MLDAPTVDQAMCQAVAQGVMPGAVLAFGQDRKLLYSRALGHATLLPAPQPVQESTIFDLASLTKVLATTLLTMKLYESGDIDLDLPLGEYLPPFYPADKTRLTPRLLLAHAAGLPAHVPFYQDFPAEPDDPAAQRCAVLQQVRQTPLAYPPGRETRYSDLGLIILGELLEERFGTSLDHLFERQVATPLQLQDTFFVHLDAPLARARRPPEAFAATEECAWRQRLIRGQVHDENAYLLRGVAGHAGLFSTVADLQRLARALLASGSGDDDFLQTATLAAFTSRQELVPGSSRALGWDTPNLRASCGRLFSPRAFGHTGFTGTSLWLDPEGERFVILLSNRVHPSRDSAAFIDFRPRLHDLVVGVLEAL